MSSDEQAYVKRKHVLNEDKTVTVFNQEGNDGDTYTYQLPVAVPIVPFPGLDVSTKLVDFFESSLLPNQSLPINRILCLGIGTCSARNTTTMNSYYQMAALEVMLELLSYNKITPTPLVYAPVYWEVCYHALEVQYPAVWIGENFDKYIPEALVPSGTQRMENDKTTIQDFKRLSKRHDMPDEIDNDHNYIANAIYWEPYSK
ncbi:hypothetical protein MMC18_008609 [Xylographa bjoerkii]|nr:hypothetical protein [Xylographa bjoerkii]